MWPPDPPLMKATRGFVTLESCMLTLALALLAARPAFTQRYCPMPAFRYFIDQALTDWGTRVLDPREANLFFM